jgi:NADP-dependent 3-hydroxy acid dehydrogenase YdfG
MSKIDSKVIVITGCSSGIGLETAVACAKAGHRVFATMKNLEKRENLDKRIEEENLKNIEIMKLDVSDESSRKTTIANIGRLVDNIDVLFNNAGYLVMGSLEDCTYDEIHEQIETDLVGPIHLTKITLPHMQNNNAEPSLILNMSSVAGKIGFGLTTSYCVSKFGIEGFTESLRRELLTKNVNVALIEAGIVHTEFFDKIIRTEASKKSSYAADTQEMENFIEDIKKQTTTWTTPNQVAKKVLEIIGEHGKNVRYIIGNDAEFLIGSAYNNKDQHEKMDKTIFEQFEQYRCTNDE